MPLTKQQKRELSPDIYGDLPAWNEEPVKVLPSAPSALDYFNSMVVDEPVEAARTALTEEDKAKRSEAMEAREAAMAGQHTQPAHVANSTLPDKQRKSYRGVEGLEALETEKEENRQDFKDTLKQEADYREWVVRVAHTFPKPHHFDNYAHYRDRWNEEWSRLNHEELREQWQKSKLRTPSAKTKPKKAASK